MSVRLIEDALLSPGRFRFLTEAELQAEIAARLSAAGINAAKEVVLFPGSDLVKASRIDFLVGRIGIEVKIKGSPADVLRQLTRYADTFRLDELVLVTSNPRHRGFSTRVGAQPIPLTIIRPPWM